MAIAGFEDGKGSLAEECGQPLKKRQETDFPLGSPEGMQPCQHPDFSPVRPTADF